MQDSTKTYQAANPLTTARAHAGAEYAPVRDTLLTGDELVCLYDDGEGHTSLWRMTALDAAGELRDIDFCIEETETAEHGSFDNPYLDLPRELAFDPFTGQPRLLTALEFLEALQRWNSAQAITEADADSVARLAQLYSDAFAQLPVNTVAAAWGGDDADAMLKRVEYDIVSYFQDTVPPESLPHAGPAPALAGPSPRLLPATRRGPLAAPLGARPRERDALPHQAHREGQGGPLLPVASPHGLHTRDVGLQLR